MGEERSDKYKQQPTGPEIKHKVLVYYGCLEAPDKSKKIAIPGDLDTSMLHYKL